MKNCGKSCFYGFVDQTIDSLMLSVVPNQCGTNNTELACTVTETEWASYSKLDLFAIFLIKQFNLAYGTNIDLVSFNIM